MTSEASGPHQQRRLMLAEELQECASLAGCSPGLLVRNLNKVTIMGIYSKKRKRGFPQYSNLIAVKELKLSYQNGYI